MAAANAAVETPAEQNLVAPEASVATTLPVAVANNSVIDKIEDDDVNVIVKRYRELSRPRQLQLLISVSATFAMMVAVFLWSSDPNYKLLYGNLSAESYGEIVGVLKQEDIQYTLDKDTGEVLVPRDLIHSTRILLATQGLPKSDGTGFEMLDNQSGFGTSQFMERARYHRAIEGELARSIAELDSVERTRVHLAIPKQSVFVRDRKNPSASVLLHLKPGRALDESQVMAIVHMVSAAVPELSSEKVTIVDQKGKLLSKKELTGDMALSTAQFDYKRKMEEYYISRVERILIPIVGFEGVRAQVDAEIDFTIIERTQETFNPDLPALRSEHTVNDESSIGGPGGVPGALTNQPPGVANSPEKKSAAEKSEKAVPIRKHRQETFNYELDKTVSHSKKAPGSLKRLTVAVVLDDRISFDDDGTLIRTKLAPEEVENIRKIVGDAVGFSAIRGDRLNVINTAFHSTQVMPPAPKGPLWQEPWFIDIVKQVVGVLLVLIFIMFALRPVIRELTFKEPEPEVEEPEDIEEEVVEVPDAPMDAGGGLSEQQWEELGISYEEYENMLQTVQELAANDPRIVAQVIKTWVTLDDDAGGE